MIRVLQVTGSLKIGGLESVAMNIVRYSDKSKFHFDFVVYGESIGENEEEAIKLGCKVFHIPYPHEIPLSFVNTMRKVIRSNGPYDIVHSHTLFNCGLVNKAAMLEGVKVRISHAHTNRINEKKFRVHYLYELLMRKYIKKYSNVFYGCSNKAGNYLFGSFFNEIGHILINGIDLVKFNVPSKITEDYKNKFGLQGFKIIGQVGTLNPVKNHFFSISLMKEILKERKDVKMLFVGKGPMFKEVQEKIASEGLSDYIYMIGPRNDIPNILSLFDLYLMPSKYEGVSVALMEAQAAGLTCLVSSTACAPEVHVTNQIVTLPLEASVGQWKDAALRNLENGHCVSDSYMVIKKAGYDILDIINQLDNQYFEYLKRNN